MNLYNPITGQPVSSKLNWGKVLHWSVTIAAVAFVVWWIFRGNNAPKPASETPIYKNAEHVNDSLLKVNQIVHISDSIAKRKIDSLAKQIISKDQRIKEIKKNVQESNTHLYDDTAARRIEQLMSEHYKRHQH